MKDADHQHKSTLSSPKQTREPLLNVPLIVIVLIAFCFCVYFIPRYFFSDQLYIESFEFFSFTPILFKDDPLAFCYTMISYSLMHGSVEHVIINMVWLLVFGSPLARHFGSFIFLVFWAITASISALTYFFFHQDSIASLIGASGAVSGMMGAVARYGFSPIHFDTNVKNTRFFGSLPSIKQAICSRFVLIYIGVWLIINFIIGISASLLGENNAQIAWEAHMGGLFSGFLLVGFFDFFQDKSKL